MANIEPEARDPAGLVSLSDEQAVVDLVSASVLKLWGAVNDLTRLRPTRRNRFRVTIFGSARVPKDHWVYRAVRDLAADDGVQRAVAGGGDTDTVAAIAGALLGARFGGSAVPARYRRVLHGWPGFRARDLVRLADLSARGFVTGASGRNWESYGAEVVLPEGFAAENKALLTDPQTSGGLLVSCNGTAVAGVLSVFRRHGFEAVAEIGHIATHHGGPRLTVR